MKASGQFLAVLILVLVEHTLGDRIDSLNKGEERVLILVLVEHTLGAVWTAHVHRTIPVLILVLVEHTLGGRPVFC